MAWYWWIIIGAVGGIALGIVGLWLLLWAAFDDIFRRKK